MEPYHSHKTNYAYACMLGGVCFLVLALLFGIAAALQYILPGIGRNSFSFEKLRPLHVSSAIFWILLTSAGSVIYYLKRHRKKEMNRAYLPQWIFFIFLISFTGILISYCLGIFGGREYWEFHPAFSIPLIAGWVLFMIYFLSNIQSLKNQPVYIWMWMTGILFFLFTYIESNLWWIPAVRNHLVKDMTIQWKSYGSMVGSWNMLIYGSSIFLMDKITKDKQYSHSTLAFGIYFLGLFNLMFNWGHHIYTLPAQDYIKHIGYAVSMTEIFLFGRMIYLWRSSLNAVKKNFHYRPYQFLTAADVWIFLTLGLAILMSIPALNVYVHGTHVIVAHTMGATIGINTMLLFAFLYDTLGQPGSHRYKKRIDWGYYTANISLGIFWGALLIAGGIKSYGLFAYPDMPYGSRILLLRPWFYIFFAAGCLLALSLCVLIYPVVRRASTDTYPTWRIRGGVRTGKPVIYSDTADAEKESIKP